MKSSIRRTTPSTVTVTFSGDSCCSRSASSYRWWVRFSNKPKGGIRSMAESVATKEDLKKLVTKEELKDSVRDVVRRKDLERFATKKDLEELSQNPKRSEEHKSELQSQSNLV